MRCAEVRAFLSQISDRETITAIAPADLDYLVDNGYVLKTSKDDYDKGAAEVDNLSNAMAQVNAESAVRVRADLSLQMDERTEHSFVFHFEAKEKKEEVEQRVESEAAALSEEGTVLYAMEANVNRLIQEKSMIDRMVPYGGGYLSLTGIGSVILSDLIVRDYRVADQEFADFVTEIKSTYAELRDIADRATSYVALVKPRLQALGDDEYSGSGPNSQAQPGIRAPSVLWASAIGLAKLRGDTGEIGERYSTALYSLGGSEAAIADLPNLLMAAEVITALGSNDIQGLVDVLLELEEELRKLSVPKEVAKGCAAAIMAGKRYDGTYPMDRFAQCKGLTSSNEAASILAVLNVPLEGLSSKFQEFRAMFTSWGYIPSDDREIAAAFLAIGELDASEVVEKLKYVVEQLKNYLEYPLVAAAILASIPVFEAHEVLDLMEKAVTLISGYTSGLERSELVALSVRMIHGVRNELVKQIDSTAKIADTPVQFTYPILPGLFIWYHPVMIAHIAYHTTFSTMGGFHPAHSHGIGGFAG